MEFAYRPKWFKILFLVPIITLPLYCAATLDPFFIGDGHEYNLQLWALASHLSPDVRLDDIENLSDYAQKHRVAGFSPTFLSDVKEKVAAGEYSGSSHLFRSFSGSYYGLHFWFYSAVAVPIKWLLHASTANELKAFQITNALLVLLALGYLFLFTSFTFEFKLTTSLLLFALGIPYYLRWPQPEVFTGVSCFIMSVAFLERRLILATFACGLAATQNPSTALMIPVIFASQLPQWLKLRSRSKLTMLVQFLAAGSWALLSFAFFGLMFGTPSLIGKEGYLLLDTVDFDRLYSLFFDLNQGMIIGAGWVMGWACLALSARLYSLQSGCGSFAQLFRREDLLIVGMFLMAIGVLPQVNWNSPLTGYARYAFWLSIPLMVWTVSQTSIIKFGRFWLFSVIAAQFFTVYFLGGFSKVVGDGHLHPTLVAQFALNHIPWAYNPEPEIFVERTMGREVWDVATVRRGVVYRRRRDSVITKVLVHETQLQALSKEVCGEGHDLVTKAGESFQSQTSKRTRYNFLYLSGDVHCVARMAFLNHKYERLVSWSELILISRDGF